MSETSVVTSAVQDLSPLPLLARGKVREIYALNEKELLFVATDRISAYDVVLSSAIPNKGAVLTALSSFWFRYLSEHTNVRTHFICRLSIHTKDVSQYEALQKVLATASLQKRIGIRAMIVRKLRMLPIESIVRGYISGSAWSSYKHDGTVNGVKLPTGLSESEQLPEPMWTPSTKADQGGSDENISVERATDLIGSSFAAEVRRQSLEIYKAASAYARTCGIIIADTKFEFGLDESTDPPTVMLGDELLTPDSSRFWSVEAYEVGRAQDSFDKQNLRNWLTEAGQKGKEGVVLPPHVIEQTRARYQEVYRMLSGVTLEQDV